MRFLLSVLAALGVAASAHAAPPPLEAYSRVPLINAVSLSPAGDKLAIIVADKGTKKVIVRKVTGEVLAGVGFGAANISFLQWAGEDHVLVLGKSTIEAPFDGIPSSEVQGLAVLNLKTQKTIAVFSHSTTMIDAIFGWRGAAQIDGHWYGFVGGVPLAKTAQSFVAKTLYPGLYRVDLDTGKAEQVVGSGDRPRDWLVGRDGQILANSVSDAARLQSSVYAGGGAEKLVVQQAGDYVDSLVGVGRAPGSLIVLAVTGHGTAVREIRVDGDGSGPTLLEGEDTPKLLADPVSGLAIGLRANDGPRLFEPNLQKRFDDIRKAFPGDRVQLISFTHDLDRMVLLIDGPKDSGRYWLFDAVDRSAAPIGELRPDIPPEAVGPMRMFPYKATDGLAMEGVLTLPPGRDPKALPLVVIPHGGPIRGGDQAGFDWWVQAFASRGYAVLEPNYRGTRGYGPAFVAAASGEFGRRMQTDISDGVAALAAAGIVDGKRVCIVGDDFGGSAALAGVTVQHGIYRCAASVGGMADLDQYLFWKRDNKTPAAFARDDAFWRGLAGSDVAVRQARSPLHLAATADAPVLLIHASRDPDVPIDQMRMMQKALAAAGKPVEALAMDSDDHWLTQADSRQAVLAATMAFVQKNNPAN